MLTTQPREPLLVRQAEEQIASLQKEIRELKRARSDDALLREQIERDLRATERERDQILSSTSWKLTRPVRFLLGTFPRMRWLLRTILKLFWWTVTLQLPSRVKQLFQHAADSANEPTTDSASKGNAGHAVSTPGSFFNDVNSSKGWRKPRALIIEHRLPTPDRTSGSSRLAAYIKMIRDEGWEVFFVSDSKKEHYHWIFNNLERDLPRYEKWLTDIGVSYLYGYEQAVDLLRKEGTTFDLTILAYPLIMHKYAPVVRAFAPLAHLVYDTVDLHGLRYAREAAIRHEKTAELLMKAAQCERMERAGFQVADTVIAITPDEAEQIILRVPEIRKPIIIPNIHSPGAKVTSSKTRAGLLFIGHYLHTPNEDAVCHFVSEIYPLIERQIPGIEFTILGSSITEKVKALATDAIHAVGYVEDAEPYFAKAKVFVAPLRYGAGMKGKLGQALSFGLPIVSTSVGAEGMSFVNERHLLVADDPEAFATAVVRLYTDNDLWQRISAAGQDHLLKNFSESAIKPTIATLLERATQRK
jgi:glycosyltransferase involved in cell wall biosynthesis